jgi:hypothetical protein
MAFNAINTARAAATDYIATHGYAAYRAKVSGLGIPKFNDMDEEDALALCKALDYGKMFAHAKNTGTTPTPKTTAPAMNDLAAEVYGGDANPEVDEDEDVELNPRRAIPTETKSVFEGSEAVIDEKAIYAQYNAPKTKRGGGK